jgi:acyl-CoA synthetase (NDP forming)
MDINKLLRPKSIAIIGASEKMGMGYGTCVNILRFQECIERVYFVHPKYDEVFEHKCFRSILEIPDEIDLAIICTSRKSVIHILDDAKQKGCGGAVVYASGYSEVGDDEGYNLEQELISVAGELDIAIMGPNCGGFVNFIDSIFAFAFEGEYSNKRGTVGMVSQSGQFCIDMMNSKDLKYSYMISAGNSNIIQLEDYLNFLVDDINTKVIAMYLEGAKNPEKLCEALRKAAIKRKPVIILKGGRSPQGADNAASHTGSIAGADDAYEAVFKKYGVIRALDLQDMRSTAMLFSTIRCIPERANFGAMCMSGGETGICADTGYLYGIKYPSLNTETEAKLCQLLPFYSTPRNPLDMTVTLSYDAQKLADGIATFVNDENIDIGLFGYTITDKRPTDPEFIMFEGIKLASGRVGGKPLVIIPFIEGTRYADFADKFIELGIPILAAPQYAFLALRHLSDFIEYDVKSHDLRVSVTKTSKNNPIVLSEYESKRLLTENGIDVYLGKRTSRREKAVTLAQQIGYPVVLKVDSADILHKTDAGCVKLNISGSEEVANAYETIISNAYKHNKNAEINGILVQKMFEGGLEIIIGVARDAQFGLIMLVGLGGIFVELFKDVSLCPIPISYEEADNMLRSLKAYKIFEGYRGGIKYDKEALIKLMLDISSFTYKNKEQILELDLNPVFVFEEQKGVEVGDALLILNEIKKR